MHPCNHLKEVPPVVTDWQLYAEPEKQARPAALEQAIKDQIVRRTGGRIQMLKVEVLGSHVVIRGFVSSYYLKQLALRGAMDAMASLGTAQLKVNVQLLTPMSCGDAQ
jgi:hypothetical protein